MYKNETYNAKIGALAGLIALFTMTRENFGMYISSPEYSAWLDTLYILKVITLIKINSQPLVFSSASNILRSTSEFLDWVAVNFFISIIPAFKSLSRI